MRWPARQVQHRGGSNTDWRHRMTTTNHTAPLDALAACSRSLRAALMDAANTVTGLRGSREARAWNSPIRSRPPSTTASASPPWSPATCALRRRHSEHPGRFSQLVNVGNSPARMHRRRWHLYSDSPGNDVEDSDTSNRADSGCSAAVGGRGEAGHPAQDPRCAPGHRGHGAVRAAHRRPRAGGWH